MSDIPDRITDSVEYRLGYQQGRADAFNEVITEMCKSPFASEKVSMAKRYIQEQLKEQKND